MKYLDPFYWEKRDKGEGRTEVPHVHVQSAGLLGTMNSQCMCSVYGPFFEGTGCSHRAWLTDLTGLSKKGYFIAEHY